VYCAVHTEYLQVIIILLANRKVFKLLRIAGLLQQYIQMVVQEKWEI